LTPFFQADDWATLDLVTSPRAPNPGDTVDLDVAAEGDALRQALLLRLLTPVGALRDLGHASYGSRLGELIGFPNTRQARQLARSYVIQAIAQERRVAKILDLTIAEPEQLTMDRLSIFIRVLPATNLPPVSLSLEVAL